MSLFKLSAKYTNCLPVVLATGLAFLLIAAAARASTVPPETALYNQAKKNYYALIDSKSKRAFRHNWTKVIAQFKNVWKQYPRGNAAPKALFTVAKLYHRLYLEHKGAKNLDRALFYYREVVSDFTDHPLADDALFQEGNIFLIKKDRDSARDAFSGVVKNFPWGDRSGAAKKKLLNLGPPTHKKNRSRQVKTGAKKDTAVKTAARGKHRPLIVIDPGHGGKDAGARSKTGLLEKHVNLAISKRLQRILETRYGYRTLITRTNDSFIPLDKRGEIANRNNADLFVSIHVNAARREGANGIETYHLGRGSSERARQTAARENGDTVYSVPDSEVQRILTDMITNRKMNDSSCLAKAVQKTLAKGMTRNYPRVKDLGVKDGPFYVLHDTKMPSILVEVGFLTNRIEQRRLASFAYLDQLAGHIARGIHVVMPIEKKCAPTI